MAKDPKKLRTEASDEDPDRVAQRAEFDSMSDRDEELCGDNDIAETCLDLYADIEKGYSDQWERANAQLDYWDIYNCELGSKQFYSGNSKIFVPIVHDAVNARKTRNTNQIFPPSGKNVEVITSENKPEAMQALLEFYIRKTRLRSAIVPQLLKNGDIEGQYNLYLGWVKNDRHVTWRVEKKPTVDDDPDIEIDDEETYWDIEEEKIQHAYPDVEVLADADVLILPATAKNAEDALAMGGSATVIRRWSKAKIKQMIRDDEIDKAAGEQLLAEFTSKQKEANPDKAKAIVDSAGIKAESGKFFALCYETWTMLKVGGERRICRVRFGGEKLLLSCKRNPYWCDHVPLITVAQDAVQGSVKGRSPIKNIETMQYMANDAINEGMDSAAYALMPIVLTDPVKNPRIGSMILSVAAIWETSPQDTQFAKFPQLWKDAFDIVGAAKSQIFQTLGINPAMLPQGAESKGKGTNQAKVAQEQQVDILTVADIVTQLEGEVLTPLMRWYVYLDHQFRDHDLTIRQFGMVGKQMNMQVIQPVQMDRRWEVKWFGVEAARSAQQMQLQMAGLNMVRGIPPQQYEGFKLNLAPVLQQFMENLFGPRVAGEVFQDIRKQLSLDAEYENTLLEAGFQVPVSPMDDDQEHMKAHIESFKENGDPTGAYREHLMWHQMNMQKKQQMAGAQQQQGQQGAPGGAGPGVPGQPRQGAKSAGPRGAQQPPGVIHRDQLRDASAMPRQRGAM